MNTQKSPESITIKLLTVVALAFFLTIILMASLVFTTNLAWAETNTDGGLTTQIYPNQIEIAGCPTSPSISFSPANPNPAEQVEFTGAILSSGGGGVITFTWNFGDGSSPNSATPIAHHSYAYNNIYTVIMTATGESCATPVVVTQKITVGFGIPSTVLYLPFIYSPDIFNLKVPGKHLPQDTTEQIEISRPKFDALEIPKQVTAVRGISTKRGVYLTWASSSTENVQFYRIYRGPCYGNGVAQAQATVPANITTYFDRLSGCEQMYYVTALNAAGESTASANAYYSPDCP